MTPDQVEEYAARLTRALDTGTPHERDHARGRLAFGFAGATAAPTGGDAVAPPPRPPCAHLGGVVGTRPCATCAGTVRLKVYSCRHPAHSDVVLDDCRTCPDHQPRPPQ